MPKAKRIESDVVWTEVDTSKLSKQLATVYKKYKEAADVARGFREEFDAKLEAALRAADHVPEQLYVVIGHKWGKVSFATTDKPPRAKAGSRSGAISV